jgi:hypothetical protein
MEREIFIPQTFYPSIFTHCLLSTHVEYETLFILGSTLIDMNKHVSFKINSHLEKFNKYANKFKILDQIEDSNIGYYGIIYFSQTNNQVVLAQKSPNFEAYFNQLLDNENEKPDKVNAIKGAINAYINLAIKATSKAIAASLKGKSSLSFTGHSLGAWLAEFCVLYSCTVLNYQYAKAFTFDGPGSSEIIDQMKRYHPQFDTNTVHITSIMSQPSIVNCTGTHFGSLLKLFPLAEDEYKEIFKGKYGSVDGFMYFAKELNLEYLLQFNTITGNPKQGYQDIKSWPSIRIKQYETLNNPEIENQLKNDKDWIKFYESILSFDSILSLFDDVLQDKGSISRIWLSSINLLDSKFSKKKNGIVRYFGNYQVEEVRKISDKIDCYLKEMKKNQNLVYGSDFSFKQLLNYYNLNDKEDTLKLLHIDIITIENLREAIIKMQYREEISFKT